MSSEETHSSISKSVSSIFISPPQTASANSLSAGMGQINDLTVTVTENSEYEFDVQVDSDVQESSGSGGTPSATAYVEVLWRDYTSTPALSQL